MGLVERFAKTRKKDEKIWPIESDNSHVNYAESVYTGGLTMTSRSRLRATLMACEYVVRSGVPGDFVECGVWRGGHGILARKIFDSLQSNKQVWMFDTFSGMTRPSDADIDLKGDDRPASIFKKNQLSENSSDWCNASIDEVKEHVVQEAGSLEGVRFVEGDVSDTLQYRDNIPESISCLRLDTDWYESTLMELRVLYPRLEKGGVLIIDDYGKWAGSKKAVDEYFSQLGLVPFLIFVDSSSRMLVKS